MLEPQVAAVDVFVLRRVAAGWELMVLRRAEGTRCTGAWEVIHGRLEESERPEDAARRELREEAGMTASRLYTFGCQTFYLPQRGRVVVAVAFAAVVDDDVAALSPEHDAAEWLAPTAARERLSWPRSRAMLDDLLVVLHDGDAGPLEDVLRVSP